MRRRRAHSPAAGVQRNEHRSRPGESRARQAEGHREPRVNQTTQSGQGAWPHLVWHLGVGLVAKFRLDSRSPQVGADVHAPRLHAATDGGHQHFGLCLTDGTARLQGRGGSGSGSAREGWQARGIGPSMRAAMNCARGQSAGGGWGGLQAGRAWRCTSPPLSGPCGCPNAGSGLAHDTRSARTSSPPRLLRLRAQLGLHDGKHALDADGHAHGGHLLAAEHAHQPVVPAGHGKRGVLGRGVEGTHAHR